MTAAAAEKLIRTERWTFRQFTLKASTKAFKGATCVIEQTSGLVKPGVSASSLKFLGVFAETVDATTAGPLGAVNQLVNVDLLRERTVCWRANDGTIAASDIGNPCYISDDLTVSKNSSSQSKAGTILAVDTVFGVAFEFESGDN